MNVSTHLHSRAGLLAVSGGALLWGTTGVAVRIIHDRSGLAAVPIGCYRLGIAAVALGLLFRGSGLRRIRAALQLHRWSLVLAGAGLGVYQALYFIGVENVGVSVSTLVSLAVAPVALTIAGAVARGQRPSAVALATLCCAVGGLTLISLASGGSSSAAPHPVIGILASLGSGIGYAATTVLNRRLSANGDALLLTAATSGIGALVLLPVALPFGMRLPADAIANGWLIYIGIVSTVIAYGLFYTGLRSTSAEVAGVLTLLEPLAATVLAVVFLGESLTALGWCGALLLLVAIAVLYVRRPEPDPAAL
ncbi:MAG: drug/metabolite transporter, family [Pseudonocardiales bacterium]|nr:drug/metabolite transporter, family [Pseudonocardiales bacterium]